MFPAHVNSATESFMTSHTFNWGWCAA